MRNALEEAAGRLGMVRKNCSVLYHLDSEHPIVWWEGRAGGRLAGLLDGGMIWIGESGDETLCVFERPAPGASFAFRDLSGRGRSPLAGDPEAARLVAGLSASVSAVEILGDAVEAKADWRGASANGIISDVRALSALKSRIEALDPPLVRAIMKGHETAALAMIKTCPGLEDVTIGRLNAMTAAAAAGRLELVRALLAAGARAQPEFGFPLHAAARAGHLEMAEALLEAGAPVDGRDGHGGTALMDAAAEGHQDVVALLLSKGADPQARNLDQTSALGYAESEGFTVVTAMLRAAGART